MSALLRMVGPLLAGAGEVFPITLGTCYVDKTATAMAWITGVDLSVFAGVAGSRKKAIFSDGTNELVAWVGEVGGGYTLGSELIVSGVNTSGGYDTYSFAGTDVTAVKTGTVLNAYSDHAMSVGEGKIVAFAGGITINSGRINRIRWLKSSTEIYRPYTNVSVSAALSITFTIPSDTERLQFYMYAAEVVDFSTSGLTCKLVTDCAVTGVYLYTDKTGSTRGITSDDGINLNAITSLEVRNG